MLNIIMCRKKEILIIIFILTFALLATYNIYYKFNNSESTDYNTDTLDITFYNKEADQINITKLTPVTDSVGLSSNAYTFKIKNNTNKSIKYSVNINDNTKLYDKHKCRDYEIPKNIIRLSILLINDGDKYSFNLLFILSLPLLVKPNVVSSNPMLEVIIIILLFKFIVLF